MCCQDSKARCGGGNVDPCAPSPLEMIGPGTRGCAITPSDTNLIQYNGRGVAVRGVLVTATGNVAITTLEGDYLLIPVATAGTVLPYVVKQIWAQGTTVAAGNLFGVGVVNVT